MNSEESIFSQAVALDSDASRADFLDRACGDNDSLRSEVEKLLRLHREAGSFLERPPEQFAATLNISQDAMDAGMTAAFGVEAAVVVGNAGHSVLKSLSKKLPSTPNVTLRDDPDGKSKVLQPGSRELPSGQNDSRYQLFGEIARGGMGAILRGRDTDLGRDLAIKVLLDSNKDNPEVIQRFVEEAQIGGQLQHPGIAPIYELGQFGDQRPFFTMKLVKGQTLAAILSKRKDPSTEHAKLLGIFEQICQTMAYAHSKGVIHRDLKPANIMVGAFGEVQVMDWGLSKVLGSGGVVDEQKSLDKHRDVSVIKTRRSTGSDIPGSVGSITQAGAAMGTPAYMPPEQALGEIDRLDERADVFGLGAILCEMLTGKPPYVADHVTEVFRMASRGKLAECFARLNGSAVEPELIELTQKSLAPEPEDRLRDAGEFAESVTAYLEGVQERLKAAELARVEAQTRAEEERRRKKLYVAIAGMIVLGVIGTALGFGIVIKKENEAEVAKEIAAVKETEAKHAKISQDVAMLSAKSEVVRPVFPLSSASFALEAVELSRQIDGKILPTARDSLFNSTVGLGEQLLYGRTCLGADVAISPNGRWLLAGWELWDLNDPQAPSGYSSRVLRRNVSNKYPIFDVAFTPDNNRAITCFDGAVQLWDLKLEDPAKSPITIPGAILPQISPNAKWLAAATTGGKVSLWDLTAEDPSLAVMLLPGQWEQISCLKFSPSGRWLACGTSSRENRPGVVGVWDLTDVNQVVEPRLLKGHSKNVICLVFGPDDRRLVSGSDDTTARVWDLTLEAPDEAPLVLSGHGSGIRQVDFSRDGRFIATADQEIRLWRMGGSEPLVDPEVLVGHTDRINEMAFSPDSRWLASASHDFTARLWDLKSDEIAESASVLIGHNERVWALAFASDNKLLATTDDDNTVRLWDLTSSHPASERIPHATERPMHALTFSPDGHWLAAAGSDKQLILWRFGADGVATQPQVLTENFSLIEVLPGMRISDDSRWLAASCGSEIQVWDLWAADISGSKRKLNGHVGHVRALAFSPEGDWLASTENKYTARLWDLISSEPSTSSILLLDGENSPICVDFSPDGKWLAIGGLDQQVRMWDFPALSSARTKLPPNHFIPCQGTVHGCQFTADSLKLVAATVDGGLVVADLNEEGPVQADRREFPDNASIMALRVTPNGRAMTVGRYPDALVWDISDASQSQPTRITGHLGNIDIAIAIDASGRWLATGSKDETVRVTDLNNPAAEPLVLQGGGGRVFAVAMTQDGRWLATGARQLRVWDLDVDKTLERAKFLVGERPEFEFREQASAEILAELRPSPREEMTPIFDGNSLDGWQMEGNADWQVEDMCIVGREGRLVYTKEKFANVEVALECQINAGGNSGLFVRTPYLERKDSWKFGYEAQVSNVTSQACLTGGIFNYARFMQPLVEDDQWFTLNFRVVDNTLTVFVNGTATTQCTDYSYQDGYIAMGAERSTLVRFRNVRVRKY